MALQTGLYYPYVHLRDETWAKAAALYWRHLARVVPAGFPVQDRGVVRELSQASGFIVDSDPRQVIEAVAPAFVTAVRDNAEALRARSAVQGRRFTSRWHSNPAPNWRTRNLTGLFPEEVPPALEATLEEAGLAYRDCRQRVWHHQEWVVVDPSLAWAYKCAITQELARRTACTPVTDQLDAYTATGDWTAEHIADTLLGRATPAVGHETTQSRLAMMAVRCVLPADLHHVPVEKIVRLRTQYADEFVAFDTAVKAATTEVVGATQEVTAPPGSVRLPSRPTTRIAAQGDERPEAEHHPHHTHHQTGGVRARGRTGMAAGRNRHRSRNRPSLHRPCHTPRHCPRARHPGDLLTRRLPAARGEGTKAGDNAQARGPGNLTHCGSGHLRTPEAEEICCPRR